MNYRLMNIFFLSFIIFLISKSLDIYKDFIYVFFDILIPIVISIFISFSLYPCAKYFNRKFSYNLSCLLVIFLGLFFFSLLFYFSFDCFSRELPLVMDDVFYFLDKVNISFDTFSSYFNSKNGMSLITTGTSIISKIIIVIVLSISFFFNMEKIKNFLNRYELFQKIDCDLYNYYKGFYLIILIEIAEYLLIYYLIGHPYFLLIAFLSGFTSVIPVFGAIISNLIALVSAYSVSFSLVLATSLVMIIVPVFNSYVVEPRIYNKTLKVSLISIIISCFSFGLIFGIIGVILSIPLFLIIKNLFTFFLLERDKI